MPFTVNVSVVQPVVTATETVSNITITETGQTFTITNAVSSFTVTNFVNNIEFNSDGGYGFDFITKNTGDWINGTTYSRNDLVRYEYSIYIANISSTATFVSSTAPPLDPARWELFVFNEWPRAYLTVTNNLTVGNTVIASKGTFTNQLKTTELVIGNQTYPTTAGENGQILVTNGTDTAYWDFISQLIFWNLTDDLQTNGFNIVTGYNSSVPNPALKLISGDTDNIDANIHFHQGGGRIDISADDIRLTGDDVRVNAAFYAGRSASVTNNLNVNGDINIGGTGGRLKGPTEGYPVPIGSGGLLFTDGTVQTTAGGGGGTSTYVLPIASASILGGFKVGANLSINEFTGVLSASTASSYNLPVASATTLGGIKVGSGLTINGNGVLSGTSGGATGTNFFNLTQDSYTNDYKISYDQTTTSTQWLKFSKTGWYGQTGIVLKSSGIELDGGVSVSGQFVADASPNGNINTRGNNGIVSGMQIGDPEFVLLTAPITVAGSDVNNSKLHVGQIYNFGGVGPPWFPEGIQLPDNTVQVTAYNNDCGLIPAA